MKPFLPVGTPTLPSHADLHDATHPSPQSSIEKLCTDAEEGTRNAKRELQVLKSVSAVDGKFVGCEAGWRAEVQGLLRGVIAAGVVVAGVRRVCATVGVRRVGDVLVTQDGNRDDKGGAKVAGGQWAKRGELGKKLAVVIPELEERYHEWWIVPKLVER